MESWKAEGPRTKTLTRQIKKTIVKVPTNSCIYAVLRERLKQHGHFSILYKIQLCSIHLCFKYQQLNPLFPFVDIYPLCCQQAFLCNIDFHCNKINELKHHGYTLWFFTAAWILVRLVCNCTTPNKYQCLNVVGNVIGIS